MRADVRAIAIGVGVGAIGAVSNVYVSLKVGWSLPVMATAAVVGLTIARATGRALTAREGVILTSLASATAFMTGGGNVGAISVLAMLGEETPGMMATIAWFATTAVLGTSVALVIGARVRALASPTTARSLRSSAPRLARGQPA